MNNNKKNFRNNNSNNVIILTFLKINELHSDAHKISFYRFFHYIFKYIFSFLFILLKRHSQEHQKISVCSLCKWKTKQTETNKRTNVISNKEMKY